MRLRRQSDSAGGGEDGGGGVPQRRCSRMEGGWVVGDPEHNITQSKQQGAHRGRRSNGDVDSAAEREDDQIQQHTAMKPEIDLGKILMQLENMI